MIDTKALRILAKNAKDLPGNTSQRLSFYTAAAPEVILQLLDALEKEHLQVCHLLLDITELKMALEVADELATTVDAAIDYPPTNEAIAKYRAAREKL